MPDATTDALLDLQPETATVDDIDLDLVCEALHDGEGLVRDRAAALMQIVAQDAPESALDSLPAIVAGIESDHINVTQKSVATVVVLTDDHVDELEATVEPLIGTLHGAVPRTRTFSAKALSPIAEAHPEWFVPHVETLITIVAADFDDPLEGAPDLGEVDDNTAERFQQLSNEEIKQQFLARATAANLLFEAVKTDPSIGTDYVDDLLAADDGSDATVTAAVLDVLAVIGDEDPIAIEGAVEPLLEKLDHPDEQVRARAVKTLGFSGDDRAVEPLRELASDDDAGDDLQDLAAQTADWIEQNTQN